MAIALDWDEATGIWTLTALDRFDLEEVLGLLDKADWKGAHRFLLDLRDLRQGPDSTPALRLAAERVRARPQLWSGTSTAIVVARDFDFAIARMFQVFAEGTGVTYEIFRDLETARAWLRSTERS